jgi:hypothetical protein
VSKLYIILAGVLSPAFSLSAQTTACGEIEFISKVAHAKSSAAVRELMNYPHKNYRSKLVLAARWFDLHQKDKSAADALLDLIPTDDQQQNTWLTIGDSSCDSESLSDMESLRRLRDNLPRSLAKAVLLAPEKLQAYVAYALVSTQDPHSDYAVQMNVVCKARRVEFVNAINLLPSNKRNWFIGHVLNPDGCRVLAVPEA